MKPLILLLTVLATCQASLTPPFDRGVVVKVSEQLIRDIGKVITDKAVEEIKETMLSGEAVESGIEFSYWHLRFTDLTMLPVIDLNKDPNKDKLVLDATIRGDLGVASRWRAIYRTWIHKFQFTGNVDVAASGYRVTTRVVLGEDDNGAVGFKHDPTACSVDLGGLDINFSGSKASWLINLMVGFFEQEIRDVLEHYICIAINEKVKEGAHELETAVFDRYDFINILGHRIEINNRPNRITGGNTCAIITALGQLNLTMDETEKIPTKPFFPPTQPPIDETTSSSRMKTKTTGTTGSGSATTTGKTSWGTTTGALTSSYTSVVYVPEFSDPVVRKKRSDIDLCSVIPGNSRGVSVIVTEEMISGFAKDMHKLKLIDYTATQARGVVDEYHVMWSGRDAGTVTIPTSEHEVLKNFNVRFRITSTTAPSVNINSDGIAIYSRLRARVTLEGKWEQNRIIRVEIHTSVQFSGNLDLVFEDGMYNLVPTVFGSSDITKAQFSIGAISPVNVPGYIVDEVENQLDNMLGRMLPDLIREELKTGYPLNIPNNLLITDFNIEYTDDYLLITAEDVVIEL